LPAKKLYLL